MNGRVAQVGIWLALGPLIGLFQGIVSFVTVAVAHPPHGREWHDIALLSLGGMIYGLFWLTPALLLVDLVFVRRPLPTNDLARFVGIIAGVGGVIGMLTPGYLVMIGVPATALAIIVVGVAHRRRLDHAQIT